MTSPFASLLPRPFLTRLEAGEGLTPDQERHALALWEWIVAQHQHFGGVGLNEVKRIARASHLSRTSIAMALLIARKRLHTTPLSGWKRIEGHPRRKGQLGYGLHADASIQAWRAQVQTVGPFDST